VSGEELTPFPDELGTMFLDDTLKFVQLLGFHSIILRQFDRLQPEFAVVRVSADVDMRRSGSFAAEKVEAEAFVPINRGHRISFIGAGRPVLRPLRCKPGDQLLRRGLSAGLRRAALRRATHKGWRYICFNSAFRIPHSAFL